jgi:hypothetical protein
MITGAMQAMLENMMKDALQNLPPDIQEKIGRAFEFLASVDARLSAMQVQLDRIENARTAEPEPVHNVPAAIPFVPSGSGGIK